MQRQNAQPHSPREEIPLARKDEGDQDQKYRRESSADKTRGYGAVLVHFSRRDPADQSRDRQQGGGHGGDQSSRIGAVAESEGRHRDQQKRGQGGDPQDEWVAPQNR